MAVDSAGNVYVADENNNTIRKVTPVGTNWMVTTLAGLAGSFGSVDGTGTNARLGSPFGMALDSVGNIYVGDIDNHNIRKVTPAGAVTTIAAGLNRPAGVAVDSAGNVYVANSGDNTVLKVTPAGAVTTIGGKAFNFGSADGAGSEARFGAQFNGPYGVAVDSAGNVYVADDGNSMIRKGVFTQYGAANAAPYSQPAMNASLAVTLLPSEAAGQWRFPWEFVWRDSSVVVSNLVEGNYPIQFRNLPDYLNSYTNFVVAVTNGGTTFVTNQYLPTIAIGGTNTGALTVIVYPNAPAGSGWRFIGETAWRSPGSTAANLLPDNYLIEFKPVTNYARPAGGKVSVTAGDPTVIAVNYLLAQPPTSEVLLPVPVPTNNISDLTNYPFGFNGQLQTDVGFGSGVAVQTNVVLTAAHLIFDDLSKSYAKEAYWYFRKGAGALQPRPLAARGSFVLSGYAARRTNDLQTGYFPGQSSPESRNRDVAALYFLSPVAGGGFGGYLPSDTVPNPWLTGTSLKMLVGYPMDGSIFGNSSFVPGLMYQTEPQPYPLSQATELVADQQVYTAPWFLSYPGNSGGPLYVQFNGYYYPAAVYLGTLNHASVVRAINSDVVNLIAQAATSAALGTNFGSGGVDLLISGSGSLLTIGAFQIALGPPDALVAGGGWRPVEVSITNYLHDNSIVYGLPVASYTLTFNTNTPGFLAPTNRSLQISANHTNVISVAYIRLAPQALPGGISNGVVQLAFSAPAGQRYAIERSTNLTAWATLATNTVGADGVLRVADSNLTNNLPRAFYRAHYVP